MKPELRYLPIEQLQRGEYQPRECFEKEALNDLAQSIQSQGLIEPLIVRKITDHQYEIIAGERRWRAAVLAKLTEVPCLIAEYTDQQAAAVAVIENIQRENLNLIEEANSYHRLTQEFALNQEDIARLVGKSRSHIANLLRLLTLSQKVQEQLRTNHLSLGHARMLVGLTPQQQNSLTNAILRHRWSVRQLEKEVRRLKSEANHANPPIDHDRFYLENQLAEQLGAPVQIIEGQEEGGWLKIKYYNHDTLAGLLERLGFNPE